MENEASEADVAGVTEREMKEAEEGAEQRAMRLRKNEETREELAAVEKMEKVKGSLKTMLANKLERTQLQKMRGMPLIARRPSVLKRRILYKGMKQRVENEKPDDEEEEEKEKKKLKASRRKSWVVGQFGDEGVKALRKGDEEELKDLCSMGVVKKRLTEKEKVRELAVKFFKHRYVLDPESTQKSNTILVTGYEPSPSETCSAVELIRQQSSVVISNFFDQPTMYPVLSRLNDAERESLERGVVNAKGGDHEYSYEPLSGGGLEFGKTRGPKKVWFQRGASLEGIGEEGSSRHDDDDHVIPKAKHVRTKSAPEVTTPLPPRPPPPSSSVMEVKTSPPPLVPMTMTAACAPPPDSTQAPFPSQPGMQNGNEPVPSPPPVLVRTPSYVSAMETDEVVELMEPLSPKEPLKRKLSKSPQSPRKKTGSPRRERRLFSRGSKKKARKREEEEEKIGSYLALSYDTSSAQSPDLDEGVELRGSHDDIINTSAGAMKNGSGWDRKDSSSSLADSPKPKELPSNSSKFLSRQTHEPPQSSDPSEPREPSKLSQQTYDPSKPLKPFEPSKSSDPSKPPRPLERLQTVHPSRPPPTHHRLTPQFSITSLSGLDPAPSKYYTPISPRVDKVTGTYATNPFARDFDRALQEQASSGPTPRNPAPFVTRSNTQLPDDIMSDEGFLEFLQMNDAKPSRSMYITYQIQLISEKIDSKYGQHLNQALDAIIPQIIANSVSLENFSAVCRSLLFKGEGFKDGLFMVPAFGKRLLGFLPGMRDVITEYTQAVLEEYAMDWLLMRGGWGELLRYREDGERGGAEERGEGAESSDYMWVWPAEEDWWEESRGGAEDSFHRAMGYGVVTSGPEFQGRSLTNPDIDLSDVGGVVERQVCDHDDRPHPQEAYPTVPAMEMGSQLFLWPVQEITPPIGRGLRRVISVEVLFSTTSDSVDMETEFSLNRASLSRISSLPSICSSILSPTSPVSIPSPRKRMSADRSSGSPSSPSVFTLPSMRKRPRPLDSTGSLATSVSSTTSPSDYRRQSSSSIRLVGGGDPASPVPSSPLTSRARFDEPSSSRPSGLVSRASRSGSEDRKIAGGCGQIVTTPTHDDTHSNRSSKSPPTVQQNGGGFHDNPLPTDNPPTVEPDSGIHDNQKTTPTNNEPYLIPVQRSVTDSSEGSYADYGLAESGDGRMTEWEWKLVKISAVLLTAAAGIAVTLVVFRKNRL